MTTIPTLDVKSRPSPDTDMRWVRWLGSMLDGSTSTGTITIKADRTSPLLDDDPDQPRSILPNPITSTVQEVSLVEDIGTRKYMYVAVPVPASDDPDLVGHGFTYTAEIKLKNGAQFGPYTFTVPLSTPVTGLWLNKVAAATPAPGEALPQITKAEFDDAVARILVLESMGGAGGAPHAASHGPGGVDAVTLSATQITTGVIAPARLGAGTADSSTVLFGDGSWKMVPGGSGSDPDAVKLSGDQTVSGVKSFTQAPSVPDGSWTVAKTTGLQVLLDGKASSANPTFTGTVTGVTKAHVGLGDVDNTADSAKTFAGSQITSGTIPPARLGTGAADSSTVLYGDGAWKPAPTGGGGGTGEVPPGTPIVRFANPDGTWPADLPTPTVTTPLILYADMTNFEGATAYPAPPQNVRNAYMRYHGPDWIETSTTVQATVASQSGRSVTFHATATMDPGVAVQGYDWTFSDGGTGTGQSPTHVFPAAGSVSGTVTVLDSNGIRSAPSTVTVTVTEGAPTVTIAHSVNGLQVTWTATAVDPEGETMTYSWTGTDALTGSTASVTKTYTEAGAKSATVTVTDAKGETATATRTVSIVALDANGVLTSDDFTGTAANVTEVLTRQTTATAGGSPVFPADVNGPSSTTVRLNADMLYFTTSASVHYPLGLSRGFGKVTVATMSSTATPRVRFHNEVAADQISVFVRGDGEIVSDWRGATRSEAPVGSFVEGDTIEARLDCGTGTLTVVHSRSGAVQGTYARTGTGHSASYDYLALVQGAGSQSVRWDDLVIGEIRP